MAEQAESSRWSTGGAWRMAPLVIVAFAAAVVAGKWLRQPSEGAMENAVVVAVDTGATQTHGASVRRGELLFQVHCAKCHGAEGHGDGESAATMRPPPRDFAARPWRFRPTSDEIRRVIAEGIPGTTMPAAGGSLSASDINALTKHVLLLAEPGNAMASTNEDEEASLWRSAGFAAILPRFEAPSLDLEGADGESRSLADLRGKVVLINFWGLGCEHCLVNMPKLAALRSRFAGQPLEIVNVCADADTVADAQEALARVADQERAYCDATGLAAQRYQVQVLPTVWLVDRQGCLAGKATGGQDWTRPSLHQLIDALIHEQPPKNDLLHEANGPAAP